MGPKYPVVDAAPGMDTVMANFGVGEYATWFGVTGLSVPLGYVAGECVWVFVCVGVCVCFAYRQAEI